MKPLFENDPRPLIRGQSHTGTGASPYTFVGQQHYYRDEQLDLYLLGMGNSDGGGRHYDPTTGAFLSKDPSGYDDDQNLYRYVHNNPLKKNKKGTFYFSASETGFGNGDGSS